MARIDASIYQNLETPKIFGAIQEGLEYKHRMSDLAKQREQNDYNFEQKKKTDIAAEQSRKMEQAKLEAAEYGRIFGGVKDQAGWESGRQEWQRLGYGGVEQMPEVFTPSFNNSVLARSMEWVDRQKQANNELQRKQDLSMQGYSVGQDGMPTAVKGGMADLNMQAKRAQIGQMQAETNAKKSAAGSPGKSEGIKALDKDFAKDYNDWTSGGAQIANTEIQKLKSVADNLRGEKVTTGGLTGMFPDRMTSAGVLSSRSDVQSTVMNSLKAILGAQFTEKEGERIIKNTWNEADTTKNNLARIDRLVGDLEGQARDKSAKGAFFQQNGTLAGYQPSQQTEQPENQSQKPPTVTQNGYTYHLNPQTGEYE